MPHLMSWTILPLLLFVALARAADTPQQEIRGFDYARKTIYHSPQTPGYTCWTSAWIMPDDSIWVCFTQATGPLTGREKTPADIRRKLSWPPEGIEGYDMNGLKMEVVYLRSTDQGESWQQVGAAQFKSPMNARGDNGTTALGDGTILRQIWGEYLPFDKSVPRTGFVEISADRTKTWSKPILLLDPDKYTAYPVRLRQLRDGRVIALGGFVREPANNNLTRHEINARLEPMLAVSADGGRSWRGPLDVVPAELRDHWRGEECDAAELPGGDLLFVFRRDEPGGPASGRWQGVLKKDGDAWRPRDVTRSLLAPGGHPELLLTQEGVVLYFTAGGAQAWTADAGKSWHPLQVSLGYYPRSVQTRDGRIFVFSHVGGDDAYGGVDQSILMDTFTLRRGSQP